MARKSTFAAGAADEESTPGTLANAAGMCWSAAGGRSAWASDRAVSERRASWHLEGRCTGRGRRDLRRAEIAAAAVRLQAGDGLPAPAAEVRRPRPRPPQGRRGRRRIPSPASEGRLGPGAVRKWLATRRSPGSGRSRTRRRRASARWPPRGRRPDGPMTVWASRVPEPSGTAARSGRARRRGRGDAERRGPVPESPSSAGSGDQGDVPRMATPTTRTARRPLRKTVDGMTKSPLSATMTVMPLKRTARPAVA